MTRIFEVLSHMSSVHRFSSRKLLFPESVLEHTGTVGVIALKMVEDIRKFNVTEITEAEELALLRRIIVHDMDGAMMGDIPRPTKYAISDLRQLLNKIEPASMKILLAKYDLPEKWYELWLHQKSGRMGLILIISDLLSVAYKFWEEMIVLNNQFFGPIGEELHEELEKLNNAVQTRDESFMAKFELKESDLELLNFLGCRISEALVDLERAGIE